MESCGAGFTRDASRDDMSMGRCVAKAVAVDFWRDVVLIES